MDKQQEYEEKIRKLNSAYSEDRKCAAEALGIIGEARAVKPLIAMLGDENYRVRRYTVVSLAELGDKRAIKPLIAALEDKDGLFRFLASIALRKLGVSVEE